VVEIKVSFSHFSETCHQKDIGEERNVLVDKFVTSYFGDSGFQCCCCCWWWWW